MRIDLNNLLSGVETKLDINYVLDLSNLIYSTYNPIKNGVIVVGRLYSKADVLYLDINISFDFFLFNRHLITVSRKMKQFMSNFMEQCRKPSGIV